MRLFGGFALAALAAAVVACGGGGGSTPATVATVSQPAHPATASPSASPSTLSSPAGPGTHAPTSAPSPVPTRTAATTPTPAPTPTPSPLPTATVNLAVPLVTARGADSIVDMIGVVTHFAYSDTVYAHLTPANPAPNGDSVLSSLQTLGVRHLRDGDGQMNTNLALCQAFTQAAAAGTDDDIVMLPTAAPAAAIPAITACVGNALRSLEGPNELDLSDANYAVDDVNLMTSVAAARGTAYGAGTLLFAPSMANTCTSYGAEAAVRNDAVASAYDYNNAHIYFSGYMPENTGYGSVPCSSGPFGAESTDVTAAKIPAPAKPFVVTETGYPDNCCGYADSGYVTPAVKVKYLLRMLLAHFMAGARYAYIYELASEHESYGLTDTLLNPKPAYTALENFIRILGDPGGASMSGALRYAVTPGANPISQVLFEKRDGSFWLVLWRPVSSWDPTANAPLSVAAVPITLTFGLAPASLKLYTFDPAGGTAAATTIAPSAQTTIGVSDTPEILQIGTSATVPVLATPQPPVY